MVEAFKHQFNGQVGWVAIHHRQPDIDFDYLFLPASRANEAAAWQQRGVKCAVYTVNNAAAASLLHTNGVDFIETNHFARMARSLAPC